MLLESPVIKIFILTALAFVAAMLWTPALTHFLYKYKMGKQIREKDAAPVFWKFHQGKQGTPTMGGILVWGTVLVFALAFFYLAKFTRLDLFRSLDFLTRSQTLLPLGALVASALVGLVDDFMNVRKIGPAGGGMRMKNKLFLFAAIAVVGAWWFYFKLDWDVLHVPFMGNFQIGWWYIPIFIFVIVATSHSTNITDGLDGLAGGLLLIAFAAFGAISFIQGRYDLAAFCGVIAGALAAFLWFNIYPARFFMGDTGSMALGVTLGIIAMLTNYAFILPVICLVFVVESGSVIIQMASKKLRGKKVFKSAPIHHHFQALGWPEPKIVMRFWVIGGISAVIGLILVIVDKAV